MMDKAEMQCQPNAQQMRQWAIFKKQVPQSGIAGLSHVLQSNIQ
jgi:hypothetical protein